MIITAANLDALRVGFDSRFRTGYQTAQPWWNRLSTEVPSSTRSNRYGWLAQLPKMREWLGDRVIQNLAEHDYSITNKDFETTIGVDRNDIEDDNLGMYSTLFESLGVEARKYPDDLAVIALQAGHSTLCYDGQNFFDTDHPTAKHVSATGTQSNYSASGMPLTVSNYQTVRATMMGFKGDNERPLGVMPNLIVVPPALEPTARRICEAEFTINTAGATPAAGAAMESNINKGTASVLVIPELANEATAWYLMDVRRPIKPLIFQNRQAPRNVQLGPDSENGIMRKKFIYGVDVRGNVGYGLWFLAYKAVA